jgi:hypothetical protein
MGNFFFVIKQSWEWEGLEAGEWAKDADYFFNNVPT